MPSGVCRAFDTLKIILNLKEQQPHGHWPFDLGIFQFQNRIMGKDKQDGRLAGLCTAPTCRLSDGEGGRVEAILGRRNEWK